MYFTHLENDNIKKTWTNVTTVYPHSCRPKVSSTLGPPATCYGSFACGWWGSACGGTRCHKSGTGAASHRSAASCGPRSRRRGRTLYHKGCTHACLRTRAFLDVSAWKGRELLMLWSGEAVSPRLVSPSTCTCSGIHAVAFSFLQENDHIS